MSEILLYYRRPDPTTWVYLSSFLTIGLFFVFRRFWSIRNLDLILLILLAPGLLIVHEGYRMQVDAALEPAESAALSEPDLTASALALSSAQPEPITDEISIPSPEGGESQETPIGEPDSNEQTEPVVDPAERAQSIQRFGFIYLFVIEMMILLRLVIDPLMVRRPLLDPNLTTGGLAFIGVSMFVFMMANVVRSTPQVQIEQGPQLGPGYTLMNMLPAIPTRPVSDSPGGSNAPPALEELNDSQIRLARIAKTLAITAHLAIVIGIVTIGNRHFGNMRAGIGCGTLYLLVPYTAQMTGRVDHVLPAALLLWAVLYYRRPWLAGGLLGLAAGLVYYPLFLLPLWTSFYWQRGIRSFGLGFLTTIGVLILGLMFDGSASLTDQLSYMFGILNPYKSAAELRGFWALGLNPFWRLPVIVAFLILSCFYASWPASKNLATLMSGSAAVMVAAQFWHGFGGGMYVAWFLPLMLLTIFRPNLQDRIAVKVVPRGKGEALSLVPASRRVAGEAVSA
ncbi:MAG: hypothetical protein AAF664_00845 [Planctomycetota bacterium]